MFVGMTLLTQTLNITPATLAIIAELDEFKGAWTAPSQLRSLAPQRLAKLRHSAMIESIGSSIRIEGGKLSNSVVEQLLPRLNGGQFDRRDEQEAAGYAAVLETVFADVNATEVAGAADAATITENQIKQLHEDLLIHSNKDRHQRGEYKTQPNNISAFDGEGREIGVVFQTATPADTPRLMTELIHWMNKQTNPTDLHPLLRITLFLAAFLEIHPFQDGNGRLSRILATLLLCRAGYSYMPYSSLEGIIEQSKQPYYLALMQTQSTIRTDNPNWQPWVEFFLRALQQQKRQLEEQIRHEKITTESLPALSLQILELARHHTRLTNAQLVELTNANRNTIKKHLAALVASRHLEQHGKGKGTWYVMRSQ